LVEGWKSLNTDPANYSAHRLLADSYSALPRHGIARVSELLQSQLLQPINITPVQPQLAESDLLLLGGLGLTEPSVNEFNPLFLRDRLALLASGILGGNDTFGDEVIQSGVWGKVSYSLGQFHYETDGFREGDDLKRDIYNVFVQASLSPNISAQAEFRYTDTEEGDRGFPFFPEDFRPNLRDERKTETTRLGFHQAVGNASDIIASVIYKTVDGKFQERPVLFSSTAEFEETLDEDAILVEGQYLFQSEGLNLIGGAGHFRTIDRSVAGSLSFGPPSPNDEFRFPEDNFKHTSAYLYSYINYPKNVTVTLGVSVSFFDSTSDLEREQINPKLGLIWNPFPSTTLRAAAFRVLNPNLDIAQTIEPTHVAGFNQFFGTTFEQVGIATGAGFALLDPPQVSEVWHYGVAIDQKFSTTIFAGAEFSKRDLENRVYTVKQDGEDYLARAYAYWTPHPWLAASAEYQFERFERESLLALTSGFGEIETHRVPLGINFFHPSGFSAEVKATYLNQEGQFVPRVFSSLDDLKAGTDQFWIVDTSIRYRLPNRLGFITFGFNNLFDKEFKFQETDPAAPILQRDRIIFGRITLAF
jgi:hypothetical protein